MSKILIIVKKVPLKDVFIPIYLVVKNKIAYICPVPIIEKRMKFLERKNILARNHYYK